MIHNTSKQAAASRTHGAITSTPTDPAPGRSASRLAALGHSEVDTADGDAKIARSSPPAAPERATPPVPPLTLVPPAAAATQPPTAPYHTTHGEISYTLRIEPNPTLQEYYAALQTHDLTSFSRAATAVHADASQRQAFYKKFESLAFQKELAPYCTGILWKLLQVEENFALCRSISNTLFYLADQNPHLRQPLLQGSRALCTNNDQPSTRQSAIVQALGRMPRAAWAAQLIPFLSNIALHSHAASLGNLALQGLQKYVNLYGNIPLHSVELGEQMLQQITAKSQHASVRDAAAKALHSFAVHDDSLGEAYAQAKAQEGIQFRDPPPVGAWRGTPRTL